MRNRIFYSLLVCAMICALVGCGKSEVTPPATSDEASVQETETIEEETSEEKEETVGYIIPDKEAETEEVEEAFEFTEEYALEKVKRAISAYEDILKSHDNYSINMAYYSSIPTMDQFEILETSDGYLLNGNDLDESCIVAHSAVMNYYDNYINHDGSYYNIAEYIEQHTKDELLNPTYYMINNLEEINTNDYYLLGFGVIPSIIYMHPNTISTDEVLDRSDIESIDAFPKGCYRSSKDDFVEYDHVVSIVIDGDHINRFAAFDSEGNLVNFVDCNEYNYNPDTKFVMWKTVYDLVEIQ